MNPEPSGPIIHARPHAARRLEVSSTPDPHSMVIFGATGDLTRRKLIPALYSSFVAGALPDQWCIVGVARRSWGDEGFRERMRSGVEKHGDEDEIDAGKWEAFARRLFYVEGTFEDAATYERLAGRLGELDEDFDTLGNRLYYLATPAFVFTTILERLSSGALLRPSVADEPWTRVVIEKPFGSDLESAQALNAKVLNLLDESQVYRIDHYLGKETVQNIIVFRFGNALWEPLWNRKYIDHVQITGAEQVDVGTRGGFYDATGAMKDLVQNHLLQVLSLCAMEPPASFHADDIRDEKHKVMRSLRPLSPATVAEQVVRAQYDGYLQTDEVALNSTTETYCALKLHIDNWRWQGVPFYLRTGKGLSHKVTEIAIYFKALPFCLFGNQDACQRIDQNVLVIRIQPDEGISLRMTTKVPGQDMTISSVDMDFHYAEVFGESPPDAYERLLVDAMRGDQTLFTRGDTVLTAWSFVMPLLNAWAEDPATTLPQYQHGGAGPKEADELLRGDGRLWRKLQ